MALSIFNSDKRVHLTIFTGLLTVGIYILFNVGMYFYDAKKKDGIKAENIFWSKKIRPDRKYDMLFLGDSRCLTGLVPEIFNQILQTDSFNASFAGGGLNAFIFRHAEENLLTKENVPFRCILLSVTPLAMSKKARGNENFHSISKRMQENSSLPEKIGKILFKRLDFKESRQVFGKRKDRLIFHPDGFLACQEKVKVKLQKRNVAGYGEYFRTMEYAPENLQEILAYTIKWRKENIFVFAFRPPSMPEMENLENMHGKCDFAFVKKMFESVGGIWLDVEGRNSYNAYDGSHLAEEEAEKFSRYLAGKIKMILSAVKK